MVRQQRSIWVGDTESSPLESATRGCSLFSWDSSFQLKLRYPSASLSPGRLVLPIFHTNTTLPVFTPPTYQRNTICTVDKILPGCWSSRPFCEWEQIPPKWLFGLQRLSFRLWTGTVPWGSLVSVPCWLLGWGLSLLKIGSQSLITEWMNEWMNEWHIEKAYIQKVYIYMERINS